MDVNLIYFKINSNNKYLIKNLPNGIEELELGNNFNLDINDLPSSIKKIKFYQTGLYDKELNNLPNFLEYLELLNIQTKYIIFLQIKKK